MSFWRSEAPIESIKQFCPDSNEPGLSVYELNIIKELSSYRVSHTRYELSKLPTRHLLQDKTTHNCQRRQNESLSKAKAPSDIHDNVLAVQKDRPLHHAAAKQLFPHLILILICDKYMTPFILMSPRPIRARFAPNAAKRASAPHAVSRSAISSSSAPSTPNPWACAIPIRTASCRPPSWAATA